MAITLWILRHGDAEHSGAKPDAQRELTERGYRQSRSAGLALAAMGERPERVFTSPRVRALQTAREACAALDLEPIVHEPLSGGFERGDLAELLATADGDGSLMVVGHEPDLSQLVHELTGARVAMAKGGLAQVVLDGSGQLVSLMRPRALHRIAGER